MKPIAKPINFFIDGKEVVSFKGDTILEVARRENIYIPTMCYLPKVHPITSCRLCIVEVEGTEGFVLSCKTKTKKGIKVTTDSKALFKERQKIMQLYTVNHPLECGVCDKSGECDLQNRTTEFKVDEQIFPALEPKREIEIWGDIQYNPSLCVLCEKCVSVSSEIVGDNNLRIRYGGYSSQIVRLDENRPVSLESVAVCPVGALVDREFKYKSNAWELDKIPSTCSHCSVGCSLNYEVKHDGVKDKPKDIIYRVTNEANFASLCDRGRKEYPKELSEDRNSLKFTQAVEAFKKCDSVKFTSEISNEEALLLQKLKEKYGFKLVNNDALSYKNFLETFQGVVGETLYSGTLEDVKKSDFIITLGTSISNDLPVLSYAVNQAVKRNGAEVIYSHPIEEPKLKSVITEFIKYETGSEEGVLSLFAEALINTESMSEDLKNHFEDLDIGYISSESNVGEEEIAEVVKKFERKIAPVIIVGKDLYSHQHSGSIAKLLGLFEKYSEFKVIIAPNEINTLGVSLICDLDEEISGSIVGYKTEGDFTLGESEGDLLVPGLISQEGTFVNLDKRVVSFHVALDSQNYSLGEIAKELGIYIETVVDLTEELPEEKGFIKRSFNSLEDSFENDGTLNRGYTLNKIKLDEEEVSLEEVDEIDEFNGSVVYFVRSVLGNLVGFKGENLFVSQQFLNAFRVSDGEMVDFALNGEVFTATIRFDGNLKGTVGLLETKEMGNRKERLTNGYPFVQIKIGKREA